MPQTQTIRPQIAPPETDESSPYYGRYISLVPGSDILATLEQQLDSTGSLVAALSEEQGERRYAPEKWSVKDLLGHVIDSERIFAYRALRIARNDPTPMEGFDQDTYARNAPFGQYRMPDLANEFSAVRTGTLFLLRHLDESSWLRRGNANQTELSVRAIAYIIAGHELHHLQILKERYL
jgi:hypothetical protein